MGIIDRKITAFSKKISDRPMKERNQGTNIKLYIETPSNELKSALNGVIDDVVADYETKINVDTKLAPVAANSQNALNKVNALENQVGDFDSRISTATEKSGEALSKTTVLEGQFNQLIINEGDSNAEIVAARVKADGTTYTSLPDRLNASDSAFESHLSDTTSAHGINNKVDIAENAKISINAAFPPNGLSPMIPDIDNTEIFDALTAYLESIDGGILEVPNGKYYFDSRPQPLQNGTIIKGRGQQNTAFIKRYVEDTPTNGFMTMGAYNSCGGIRDMTILNTQLGGAAISIISSDIYAAGTTFFESLNITGEGTMLWDYDFYEDGSAWLNMGVRNTRINKCDCFHARLDSIYVKGFVNATITGTGCYATGGGVSTLHLVGATFQSTSLSAYMVSLGSVIIDGWVDNILVSCPTMASVTTTNISQMTNITIVGRVNTKDYKCVGIAYIDPIDFKNTYSTATNKSVNRIGSAPGVYTLPNGKTMTLTLKSYSQLINIFTSGGHGAFVHSDFGAATVTLLSNPSGFFVASSTPSAGKVGIFKSADSKTISIKNNSGGDSPLFICAIGTEIEEVTEPV